MEKLQKVAGFYNCVTCQYKSGNKANFEKHLLTRKHQLATNVNEKVAKSCKKYICHCGKDYITNSGLWRHKQKCEYVENVNSTINQQNLSQEFVLDVIKKQQDQITELTNTIKEMAPLINNTNNTINNTQNNKFNINVFLNEDCKNAINMTDFIKSIKISIEQLDTIKTTGMADGLSSAIITNLKNLSVYERPIHCTDIKRETLYIRDDNQWDCDRDKTRIKTAIKQIAGKPYVPLQEWIAQNPDFKEVDEKQDYVANVLSTIGKSTDNIDKKIIKNVCVSTLIK
jgi:hypothetical protein